MAVNVVDRVIQVFGAEGVSQDQELAARWAGLRTLRIADVSVSFWRFEVTNVGLKGPDAVCNSRGLKY